MFNQRASEPCGAVQAGYMVTAVEDIPPTTSDSTLSSPSEVQNPNPLTNYTQTPEFFLDNDFLKDDDTLLDDESDNEPASHTSLHNQRFHTGAFNIQ